MKHTKGNWKITKVKNHEHHLLYCKIASNNGHLGFAGVYGDNVKIPDEECEANAKLIAAAPELLEALKAIDERLENCSNSPICADEIYDSFYKDIVQQAIKKATE